MAAQYLATAKNDEMLFRQTLQAVDDINFIGPVMKELNWAVPKAPATHRPTYLYQFDYRGSKSPYPQQWIGAEHTDEIRYVFNVSGKQWVDKYGAPSPADVQVSEQMMEMWTSFAKTGVPAAAAVSKGGAVWKPYGSSEPNYLRIDVQSESKMWIRPQVSEFYKTVLETLNGSFSPGDDVLGR
jgi:carboxylesterase type B